ncbi:ATP-binding cassette sub-family G member 1-like [Bradysia coprophila]|uniref:ATP-binding cassette sub-family G member 1-like n=1 Tax=Bradysia coprophila TaxID=38358 RepID=UPI00187D710C|nr:ATP-binding cassette sub-family G member 1-like [Bradysia coprophila]
MVEGIDITFKQLTYKTTTGIFKKTEKNILDCISGTFRAGELSVILGPSGSGRTTLLNILSGLVQDNFQGTLNTDELNYTSLRNQSSYIMQDQMLHPLLTVAEAMDFAIQLKTGKTMDRVQRTHKCNIILKQLGLTDLGDTLTENLSGGERKRLSIAVELVNDPSILFLDEPTTGLDSHSSSKFVTYLSGLAKSGKCIICSIHCPSALMFQAFDHVYAIAEGKCIYQGSNNNLLTFLSELDLSCPESYNPADYLMEIATNQYGNLNYALTEKIENGLDDGYRKEMYLANTNRCETPAEIWKYKSTFIHQLLLLIQRNLLLMKRNRNYLLIRLAVSISLAILTGISFNNLGHLANHIFDNYKFIYTTTQFLTYSSFYSLMIRFPTDLSVLRREHFNRWYSSSSYYLALTIADIPVLIGVTIVFISISYYMTGQPIEHQRIMLMFVVGILISFTAQAFGLLASSIFSDVTISLVIGAGLMAVHMIFCGVLVLRKDVQPWLKWIFDITFLSHGNDGMVLALFGYNREKLECERIYCHYAEPKDFLKLIDAPSHISFHSFFIILLIVHSFTYINMMMKLKKIN